MALQVEFGARHTPARYVIHGPEGVGKTTLAAMWPKPLFIDTENGSERLDVSRLPKPTSVQHFFGMLNDFKKDAMGFKTLIIDTADWLQDLFIQSALAQTGLKSMGWTKEENAYTLLYGEWTRMLDMLSEIVESGVHVVVVAHSEVKKREVPEEFGAFDRYQLKLLKGAAAKLCEWAEYLWFVNLQIEVVKDGKGDFAPKKGTGGQHIIYTTLHPCWSAKSKTKMKEKLVYEDGKLPAEIRELISKQMQGPTQPTPQQPQPSVPAAVAPIASSVVQPPAAQPANTVTLPAPGERSKELNQLIDLMQQSGIQPGELLKAIAARGHFPVDTPLQNLPGDYIAGMLIPNWTKIAASIKGVTSNAAAA